MFSVSFFYFFTHHRVMDSYGESTITSLYCGKPWFIRENFWLNLLSEGEN